ncbi:MAG: nucleotide exchange factor GrpE [Terriglobales bacterium]
MAKGNGKTDVQNLDAEHELPAAEEDGFEEQTADRPAAVGAEDELKTLREERDVLYDRLARLQAEFDNARKRAARDQLEFREYAVADAIKALLPMLDSFDRALEAHAGDENFRGVELINRQFHDALVKLGVRPIPAAGEPFDPHLHQAVEVVDTSDAADNTVLEELQRGYKFKDRLLRPAMVRVARNPNK